MTLNTGAQSGNVNSSTNPFDDFKWDFNSAQLFGALLCGIIWCTFLTFYNSRLTGFIVTRLVNRFLLPNRKDCYIKFGSFSFSSLSGKIIFREFIYADHNMTVRIQDGFLHFRFWLPYSDDQLPSVKKFSNDPRLLPASKCRVSMHLNGLEVHAYNWLSRYARISRLFHLGGFSVEDLDKLLEESGLPTATHFLDRYELRKLIPAVHVHVSSGHCAFGNKFMPSTLTVDFETLNSNYTTTRSSNDVDLFMHILKGTCENFKMSFVKTPDFYHSDDYEKPPRIMGEGFVVLQTSTLGFYHYQDEVAIVPLDRRRLHYVTDDVQAAWGTNVSLGKGTVISYGPWADAQRLKAFKFFFPEDFQVWPMTPRPGPGKKRLFTKYELKVNLLNDATLDLLFMRSDVPNAIHINFVKGSWVEVVLPWRIDEIGCATQIQGQLLMFDSSTSLEYRHFLSGETLSFSAILGYPRAWFEHHCWEFLIKISKARLKFLYAHKSFLQDLINEWIEDSNYDDPNCFVPYTYVFDVKIDDFELTLLCNDKNWIDTSSQAEENCYIGLKGENLVFNSSLPFVKFYQSVYDLKNYLTCENLKANFYLPDQHLLKYDLQALYESSLVQNHGCTLKQDLWSDAAKGADGWFDCWAAPTVSLSISYVYHSMLKGKEQNKPIPQMNSVNHKTVDLSSMEPDLMTIDIELGSSVVFLSAMMIKFIFIMKGNYLGECNKFTDIQLHANSTVKQMFGQFLGMTEIAKNTLDDRKKKTKPSMTVEVEELDLRNFRPFNVKFSLTLHDVQGHVLTQGFKSDSHCPVVFTDQFVFELDKNFDECLIQLSIAPVLLHNVNTNPKDSNRPPSMKESFVEEGRLILTSFQMRGHGLYSPEGLSVDAPTAEYAWMMEFLIGRIEGTLTMAQLSHVISAAKMFLDHLINNEDSLIYPKNLDLCHHMCPRLFCAQKCRHTFPSKHTDDSEQEASKRRQGGVGCWLESDLKYKMFRFSADDVNVFVVDVNTALHLKAKPIRFSMCTEHLSGGEEGGCLNVGSLTVSQFVRCDTQSANGNGAASSQKLWVICGLLELDFPTIQFISPWTEKVSNERTIYQKFHDSRTHRLWFLQSKNLRSTLMPYVCGCRGNCIFYGSNPNGPYFDVRNIHQEMNNDQKKSITLAAYNFLSTVNDMSKGNEPSTSNVAPKTTPSSAFGRSLLRTGEPALRLFNDRSSCSSNVYSITAATTSGMSLKMDTMTKEVVRISPESGDEFFDSQDKMNARRKSSAITAESDNLSFSSTLTSRPAVNAGASGIARTPSGSAEESSLDFCEEMGRPITTSTLLMESYRKFLPLYSLVIDGELGGLKENCRANYTQIVNKILSDTPEKIGAIPKLTLLREGLLREKSYYRPYDDTKSIFSAVFDQKQFEATAGSNANRMPNTKTSIEICIDVNISVFVTPLSLEISQDLMEKSNFARSEPHPSRLVHDLLASCSLKRHEQALINTSEQMSTVKDPKASSNASSLRRQLLSVLRFRINLSSIDICVLQCGISEKCTSGEKLARNGGHLLTQVSCALVHSKDSVMDVCFQTNSTKMPKERGPKNILGHKKKRQPKNEYLSLNADLDTVSFQVVQLVDPCSPVIGIPRNASIVPFDAYFHRWKFLTPSSSSDENSNITACCVSEGCLKSLRCQANLYPNFLIHRDVDQILTACENVKLKHEEMEEDIDVGEKSATAETSKPHAVQLIKPRQSSAQLSIEKVSIKCGLCRPLETNADAWFLYDLFTPAINAWVHAGQRFAAFFGAALDEREIIRKKTWLFLLIEAMELPKASNTSIKNKFEPVRFYKDLMRNCATCQLCLCLTRYCVDSRFKNFELRLQSGLDHITKDKNYVDNALTFLLHHWREILCAENLVKLRAFRAAVFLEENPRATSACASPWQTKKFKSKSLAKRTPSPVKATLIDIESKNTNSEDTPVDKTTEKDRLLPPKEGETDNVGSKIESVAIRRGSKVAYFKRKDSGLSSGSSDNVAKSGVSGGNVSARSTGAPEQKEDLYTWMARQQEIERNKIKKDSLGKTGQKATDFEFDDRELNPYNLSLQTFFDVFYCHESLMKRGELIHILFALGDQLSLNFKLKNFDVILVEPNQSRMWQSDGGYRRIITHSDQQLATVENLQCLVEANFQSENDKRRSNLEEKSDEQDANRCQITQKISYKVDVNGCSVTAGFASLAFLNELSSIVQSVIKTVVTLQAMPPPGVANFIRNPSIEQEISSGQNTRKSSGCSIESKTGKNVETKQSWTEKLNTMVNDSQQRRKHDGRGSATGNTEFKVMNLVGGSRQLSSAVRQHVQKTYILKTNIDGYCAIHGLEISAVFTELFVKAVVSSLEFAHLFEHACDFAPSDYTSLMSATESVSSISIGWKNIVASLSEAQQYPCGAAVTPTGMMQSERIPENTRGYGTLLHMTIDISQIQFQRKLLEIIPRDTRMANTFQKVPSGVSCQPSVEIDENSKDYWKNSLQITLGKILVDIPLDPGFLHDVVLRGQKDFNERFMLLSGPQVIEEVVQVKKKTASLQPISSDQILGRKMIDRLDNSKLKYSPLAVINFKIETNSIDVKAALLPSLRAAYSITSIKSSGLTGGEAQFVIDVAKHGIIFDLRDLTDTTAFKTNVASEVSPQIDLHLPSLKARGTYVPFVPRVENAEASKTTLQPSHKQQDGSGTMIIKEGGYLHIDVSASSQKHTLTTDRLNQCLFMQEAFTRELVEIMRKILGERTYVHSSSTVLGTTPASSEALSSSVTAKKQLDQSLPSSVAAEPILFSLEFQLETLQITATTPTSTAVRLEGEKLLFKLTNRYLQKSEATKTYEKVFAVAEVNFSLTLGQLFKNAMYEELEPEFQQFATFKTQITARSIASHDSNKDGSETSRTYLVNLKKPMVFIQPSAVDKALILWMNYSNTYNYWNEQRAKVRPKRPQTGAKVPGKLPVSVIENVGELSASSPLFFQITIDDGLYMVMPLLAVQKSQIGSVGFQTLDESNAALLVSLETTSIAVCSSDSLVSKGKFKGFCVRFVEDFDASIDAWRPHSTEKLRPMNAVAPSHGQQNVVYAGKMSSAGISQLHLASSFDPSNINMCYVRSGTYDVCSKTSLHAQVGSAQWILNISWQMEGLDISLNTRMGRLCSLLTSTLTSFVAENYADDISDSVSSSANINKLNISTPVTADTAGNVDYEDDTITNLPNFDRSIHRASKAQLAIQMRRQSKILSEMIRQGASEADIETERRKLQRYEAALYADFKQDLSDKIRYQSQKATTTFKDSIGWTGGSRVSDIDEQKKKRTQRRLKNGDDSTVTDRRSSIADEISKAKLLSSLCRTTSVDSPSFLTGSRMANDDKIGKYPPRIDDKKDVLSKKVSETSSQSRSAAPLTPIRQHRGGAPSVDLYLDLKIYVDNGQCTFRSSATGKPEPNSLKQSYRSRILNPLTTPRTRVMSNDISATQTVIPLPGLNVKSYYASKNSSEKKICVQTLKSAGLSDDVINQMTSSTKRGQFYLCLSLERMPVETVVGTHILDFIEQTLEPISNFGSPGTKWSNSALGVRTAEAKETKQSHGDLTLETVVTVEQSETVYTMSSFPVDVIIYMNIQSSNLRFVSQPHSMIECLLRLPQLKLVATSRKADTAMVPASSKPANPKNRQESGKCSEYSLSGGISITILLNDFCLFVYHPYQTLVTNRSNIGPSAASSAKDSSAGTQHSTSSDRRDALSLSIKEIIVDITRSQNVCTIGSPSSSGSVSKTAQGNAGPISQMKNSVRCSLLVDVGDAKFKHDIRHLNEVLCFVKAWYRNAIFRRLFLGEESHVIAEPSSLNFSTPHSSSYAKSPAMRRRNSSSSASSQTPSITSSLLYDNDEENFFSAVHDYEKQGTKVGDTSTKSSSKKMKHQTMLNPSNTAKRRWEALILFGLNFNELLVETTMGPVMSHTTFKIAGAVSQGHVEIDSEGNKDVLFKLGMNTCQFEAKQGMVGCLLTLNETESYGHIVRLKDRTPEHRFGGSVNAFCIRIDWLTYTKFIGKITHLAIELHDLWTVDSSPKEGKAVVEKCSVRLNSDVKWDSIFLMITRTTVNDFIRVYDKLCEFFAQQVRASRMVLIPEAAMTTATRITTSKYGDQKASDTLVMASELCYHEHWNTALELITKIQNRVASFFPLPKETTVLGGNFEFNCREIALACFHGLNFTSEKWLIFYLLEAYINFSAEAKDIALGNNLAVKVLQNLTFRLEKDRLQLAEDKPTSPGIPMGTILRVSRNGPFYPPQGSTIEQWLSYTFTSVLTESHGFSVTKDRWTQKASSNLVDFLFKMPALRFNQKSDHEQPSPSTNNKNQSPTEPVVKCSLVAGFDGYILITQQLDAIMTLADMVRSYLTEMGPLLGTPPIAQPSEPPDPMQRVKDDARRFFTIDWQVDPLQINFITLGEKQSSDKWIKIDKFLEKGLEHAFTTMGLTDPKQIIPQWIQRGCMDPLDSFMATLMEKVLKLSENNE